ncbi:hypothetical protein BASA50_005932 [Batrachochytrium salamandrivorans]|uniref:Multiple inositol polyphosphate phosphatase 1 n=1 Tax=Batrachochytrium salamandrivorans TaxID=1357716 RepID=A0ABQ8FCP3_9FUNG|nr:hypothetical protein BASA50_005932 [Batrachochytrium salamandrivorans]
MFSLLTVYAGISATFIFNVGADNTSPLTGPVAQSPYASALSTKAPYEIPTDPLPDVPPMCTLKHLRLIARHGTRYPTKSSLKSMYQFAEFLQNNIGSVHHPAFMNLSIPYPADLAGELSEQGERDMDGLAKRARLRYQGTGLLQKIRNVAMRSSKKNRTIDSAKQFYKSLFNSPAIEPRIFVLDRDIDADLAPFKACKKYEKISENITDQGAIWSKAHDEPFAKQISSVIGDSTLPPITVDQLKTMGQICAFAVAFGYNTDICDAIGIESLQNLAIAADLEKYGESGYGESFNPNLACSVLNGVFIDAQIQKWFKWRKSKWHPSQSVLSFGHAETIIPLITALGLFNDGEKLTADMTKEQLLKRKWNLGTVSSFSANIWFEIYSCESPFKDVWIRVILNEKAVQIPGCSQGTDGTSTIPYMCSLGEFEKAMSTYLRCDFDKQCDNTKETRGGWNFFGKDSKPL